MTPLRPSLFGPSIGFVRLVESDNDASVLEHVAIVEAARAELSKTRTAMLLRIRRSSTADQRAKFMALADQRHC